MLRTRRKNRRFGGGEPENPMDGLSNLTDVMLVFSCGLLLALILNYNIDVSQTQQEKVDYDYEIEASGDGQSENVSDDSGFQEMGTVYVDPKTGKMYVVDTSADGDSAQSEP